jgi:hypothetical protein
VVADTHLDRQLGSRTDRPQASMFGPTVLTVAVALFCATPADDLVRGTQAEVSQYTVAIGFAAIAIERWLKWHKAKRE